MLLLPQYTFTSVTKYAVNQNNNDRMQPMAMAMEDASAAPSFSEKSFSDFHLYTLSEPVDLE